MKLFIKIMIVLMLQFATDLFSQGTIDVVGFSSIDHLNVRLNNPLHDDASTGRFDLKELDAFFTLPKVIGNGRTTLINKLDYNLLIASAEGVKEKNFSAERFNSIQYKFGIVHSVTKRYKTIITVSPTIASNFSGRLSSKDFSFQGALINQYKFKPHFEMGLGLAYIRSFGDPTLVPVFSLKYKRKNMELKLRAPLSIKATLHAKRINYSVFSELKGNKYHLIPEKDDRYSFVKYSRYNIGVSLGVKLRYKYRLDVSGGYSVNRIFVLTDNNQKNSDFDLKNGAFIKLGIFFFKPKK